MAISKKDDLLTTTQAAEVIGVSVSTVIRMAEDGTLPPDYITDGGHKRFRRNTIEGFKSYSGAVNTLVLLDDPRNGNEAVVSSAKNYVVKQYNKRSDKKKFILLKDLNDDLGWINNLDEKCKKVSAGRVIIQSLREIKSAHLIEMLAWCQVHRVELVILNR